jgi:hypothetical protein
MAKYQVQTDLGTYEVETDDAPSGASAPNDQTQNPTFLSELYNQTIGPLKSLYDSANTAGQQGATASMLWAPTQAWNMVKNAVGAQVDQGKKTWDALTGKGEFQGYTPLERASETVGHGLAAALPIVGPMAANAGENFGSGHVGAGIADVLPIAGAMVAPEISKAIPSTARAGAALDDVMTAARNLPVDLTDVGNVALRTRDLASSGGSMPKVISDFIKRATDPNKGPLTYGEARDFYSNATRLSADEFNRLTPVMKKQVGQFTGALNRSISDSAGTLGLAPKYEDAMAEYASAKKWSGRADTAGKAVGSIAKKAIPLGVGWEVYHMFKEMR